MVTSRGALIITLDFELSWAIHGENNLASYRENLLGVRSVIPYLLKLFKEYEIQATWATVGFLFFESREDLLAILPQKKPNYKNKNLCNYCRLEKIGNNEAEDPLHYGLSLIEMIQAASGQEIASHTFSHYYCLEPGQDAETFDADLDTALRVAKAHNLSVESLVFPKNQINKRYLSILTKKGIKAYRGNELSWLYTGRSIAAETLLRKTLRLLDAYLNLSGHNACEKDFIKREFPLNIPSSRFLRPYSQKLAKLEPLRLARILSDLTYAAKNGRIYHLWWHPHNFGVNQAENFAIIGRILEHFQKMKEQYGMESLNMKGLTAQLLKG